MVLCTALANTTNVAQTSARERMQQLKASSSDGEAESNDVDNDDDDDEVDSSIIHTCIM